MEEGRTWQNSPNLVCFGVRIIIIPGRKLNVLVRIYFESKTTKEGKRLICSLEKRTQLISLELSESLCQPAECTSLIKGGEMACS